MQGDQLRLRVTSKQINRRQFLRYAAGGVALGIGADALLWEPYHPKLVRVSVSLPHWPRELDGFTITQLSDLHYDPLFGIEPIKAAVRRANQEPSDLVVLTGDFVTLPALETRAARLRAAEDGAPCGQLLKQLKSRYGLYACLGNHDEFSYADIVAEGLQGEGIEVLRNRAIPIVHQGTRFFLGGVNDVLGGDADLDQVLRGISPNDRMILLAHEPDFADRAARYPIDLQLSGHSHGGQIRFPLVGALYFPKLGKKYPKGLREVGNLTLYTNVGIGTIHIPARWNCPPEVTRITLMCGAGTKGKGAT